MRFARWSELTLNEAVDNTKIRKAYSRRKTLWAWDEDENWTYCSAYKQAFDIFKRLHAAGGKGEVIFPSDHDLKSNGENTVNNALRVMGYDTKTEVCGHGFRTMARGALSESKLWNDDAIERQLSHVERKNVKGSYMHTSEYLEERRLMLQWWADYIDANKNGSVTPYDFARMHGK